MELQLDAGMLRQQLFERARIDLAIENDRRWHIATDVVLRQKCFDSGLLILIVRILRKKTLVPPVLPATHDHQIDANEPARTGQRNNVRVHAPAAGNELGFPDFRERTALIAIRRCLFVGLLLGGPVHALLQPAHGLVLPALQKQFGAPDVLRVSRFVYETDTRARAAPDLVEQTGARSL